MHGLCLAARNPFCHAFLACRSTTCAVVRMLGQAKAPDCEAWHARMAQYGRVAADAAAQPGHTDLGFLRVACAPVQAAVRAEALAWVAALCEAMRSIDIPALQVSLSAQNMPPLWPA